MHGKLANNWAEENVYQTDLNTAYVASLSVSRTFTEVDAADFLDAVDNRTSFLKSTTQAGRAAFIARSVKREALSCLRKRQARRTESHSNESLDGALPSRRLDNNVHLADLIQQALGLLSSEERMLADQYLCKGLTFEQIGNEHGCVPSTVYNRWTKIRLKLARFLEQALADAELPPAWGFRAK